MATRARRIALLVAVTLSGTCGLTWEVLWQHHAGLALGISSAGTAITLAAVMAGLGLGGLLSSRWARSGRLARPMLAYAVAELAIGVGGFLAPHGFALMAKLDGLLFASSPALAALCRAPLTGLVLLVPATAMGATIPMLAPHAARLGTNVAVVYALNTFGAVLGVLLGTFVLLPAVGVAMTAAWTAVLNLAVAVWAYTERTRDQPQAAETERSWPPSGAVVLAAASGLVVFMLEVSWFRSMRAAFQSSTETFAILLTAFLLCLSLGAWLGPRLGQRFPAAVSWMAPVAAFAVLASTPAVDRLDLLVTGDGGSMTGAARRLAGAVYVVFAPVTLLGLIFPTLLRRHDTTSSAGRLYAANTLGAVVGALVAGFVLLPWIGATHTSWLAAVVIAVAGAASHPTRRQAALAATALLLGAVVAFTGEADAATGRTQGFHSQEFTGVVYVDEGPDSTVWVTENVRTHDRALIIDGFRATGEGAGTDYMRFMGHLPALAASKLDRALVICFGTGQTAHALWQHGPARLDVVDLSQAVFDAAHHFPSNERVLERDGVHATTMDGRAYLRRHREARFDVVTLEPMPPNHAGVNNLYSREFYELIARRLSAGGVVAQWVPYHLISTAHMRSIVAAFIGVFPDARLWHHPERGTGILLGGKRPWTLQAGGPALPMPREQLERQFVLDARQLAVLAADARPVTDDNQLLSYGLDRLTRSTGRGTLWSLKLAHENHLAVKRAAATGGSR